LKALKLPAKIDQLSKALSFAANYAEAHGFSTDRILPIEVVLEEAFVNICLYAYDHKNGEVEIICRSNSNPQGITVEIVDSGKLFNPLANGPITDQTSDVSRRRIGGLGILMLRQMTDEVFYTRSTETNHLTLTFYNN
jgi:anti-sigma regulatory factor (Ser/Thr protein kinase)